MMSDDLHPHIDPAGLNRQADAQRATGAPVNPYRAEQIVASLTEPDETSTSALWAVHVAGPDDILAMPDRATADAKAAGINAIAERIRTRPDANPDYEPRLHATVVEWDGTAADHAAAAAALIASGGYQP